MTHVTPILFSDQTFHVKNEANSLIQKNGLSYVYLEQILQTIRHLCKGMNNYQKIQLYLAG